MAYVFPYEHWTATCRFDWYEACALSQLSELGQVQIERDNRHGDLPSLEDFRMEFADDADRLTRHENPPCATLQKGRMLNRLEAVLFPKIVKQHIDARMNL